MGDTTLCPYDAGTFGSRSIKYFGPPMRQAAAEARGVLVRMASARLGTPEDALATKDGEVYLARSPSKKVSYADLIGGKRIEVRLEKKPAIKPISKHTVSGKPTLRIDAREKVTGEAKFAGDIRLPGMLYAAIVRPPFPRMRPRSSFPTWRKKMSTRSVSMRSIWHASGRSISEWTRNSHRRKSKVPPGSGVGP